MFMLFQTQREEILSHQLLIDRFTDEAQNLMHTSSDVRLSTQVTQLTSRYQGLLSLTKVCGSILYLFFFMLIHASNM